MEWIFEGLGTLIIGLILGGASGGAIGYKIGIKNNVRQTQKVKRNSTGIQAGRDVKINK